MRIAQFKRLAALHGGDLRRWPVPLRGEAAELAAESDEARRLLRDAGEVDTWLDAAPDIADDQVERVLRAIERRLDQSPPPLPGGGRVPPAWWAAAAGFLAAMGVVGWLAGDPAQRFHYGEPPMSLADAVAPSYLGVWQRCSRSWLVLALIASLGGNMLLGGYLWRHFAHHGPPGIDRFVDSMAAGLPPDDAAILRNTFAEHREALREPDHDRDAFHERIGELLQAEPFSPEALAAFFAEQRESHHVRIRLMEESIVKAAAAMSPQGRRQMARFRP